ncbi:MAG: hypothetical protein JSW08_03275 [archaeon]|nr:MAG: hypothetical protein JSW08_03275 [archaeon]
MPIAGFGFNKIFAEKHEAVAGQVKVDLKIDFKDIKKEEIKIQEQEAVRISFNFSITYTPKIAEIAIEGELLFLEDPKVIKTIVDKWKDKKLDESVQQGIFNFILSKCTIKALTIEEELGIPLHMPFPRVKEVKEKEKK